MSSWIGAFVFGAFVFGSIVAAIALRRIVRLKDERDDLLRRITFARLNIFPLLDDALYQSIKAWRKKHPKGFVRSGVDFSKLYFWGKGGDDADLLVRAFYRLNPTPDEQRKLDILVAKMETKSGMEIRIDFKL